MILHRKSLNLTAFLLTLMVLMTGTATAIGQVRFDFEQPYFLAPPDTQCKDHSVVKVDDTYHVFYIESLPRLPEEVLRHEKWLAHMTSTDLRHWTRIDSILPVTEVPGSWEETCIWAPKVIRNLDDTAWYMLYTGVNSVIAQQTGLAYSWDLESWSRWPINPVYHPGEWSNWIPNGWANCRDPEIFNEEGSPDYFMLNTASTSDDDGALSLAVSQNLILWEDLDPLFVNDSSAVLESPQLLHLDGLYHLFFTEQYVQGTSHMTSPNLQSGWTKDNRVIIDAGNAPEISRFAGGENLFSRHDAILTPTGEAQYYFRFDLIDLDTPDDIPQVIPLEGLSDDWTILFGSAFDNQPTWGDNPAYRGDGPSGLEGNSYIATYENFPRPTDPEPGTSQGNTRTGLLKSGEFTIVNDRFTLRVGGGDLPEHCFVAMVRSSDGAVLFSETGEDSHTMRQRLWDTTTLIGEAVYLVVADLAFHDWGHISVDSIEEYPFPGSDPVIPSLPLDPPPLLEEILTAAGFGTTGTEPMEAASESRLARLLAPYPNPFNPHTRLRYELAEPGVVSVEILDPSGRLVNNLFSGNLAAGPGFFTWDGRDDRGEPQPSGVYFARLLWNGKPAPSRKLVLVR